MKKLFALILALSLAGCSASQPAHKPDDSIYENPPTNSIYKSMNNRISGTKAGDGCAYTIIRHSDTIEIGIIDIETATIKPLGEETAVEKVGAASLFFTDGYLYLVQNDSIHSYSGKMYQNWYQFSPDGKLLNNITVPDYIVGIGTDFVSDGKKIYFTGSDMEENEGIISIDHETMTVENFYDYDDDSDYMLMGASNDRFVIKEIVVSKADDGVLWQKSNYFLLDPQTYEKEYIIEQSDYLRELFGDNYITCPADGGGIEVYNITSGESTVISLPQAEKGFLHYNSELLLTQNHFLPKYFDAETREKEIYYICNTQTGNYLEIDGSTAIKGVLPKIAACVDGYYLTETPGDIITVPNGKEVVDFSYSWIKVSDLLSGKQNYTPITKEFEYR